MAIKYVEKLTSTLVTESGNPLFYEGNIVEGAKSLTKQVTKSLEVDRCSVWLYNDNKTSIICQQLYVKSEDVWHQNTELHKKDFKSYFDSLLTDPIIIAEDALTHPATICFAESYLKPLGIKSMLDVPIIYRGEVIGVICIEHLSQKYWLKPEIDFVQMLAALYSFAYSVKIINCITKKADEKNLELQRSEKENARINRQVEKALTEAEVAKQAAIKAKDEAIAESVRSEHLAEEALIAKASAEEAYKQAEEAKTSALSDLDILQKKSQTALIGTIVKVALYVIVGVGIITSIMYAFAMVINKDTQIIGSTWSNMFGILLTNAFSIVGTLMGVKYASEGKKE
jgi:signal transduction protein with GAF and PtsI domain